MALPITEITSFRKINLTKMPTLELTYKLTKVKKNKDIYEAL